MTVKTAKAIMWGSTISRVSALSWTKLLPNIIASIS
jgi:hypothetical protein